MDGTRDRMLSRVESLIEANIRSLKKSKLPCENGLYRLKNFEVKIGNSPGSTEFDFWRIGKEDKLSVGLTNDSRSFVLYEENLRTVLGDFAGLKIEKFVNKRSTYPHFQFSWNGVEDKNIAKGDLKLFRVDLSGRFFVSYCYDFTRKSNYFAENHTDKSLAELGLPEDLNEASIVLGQPIIKKIDFKKEEQKIFEMSRLEELSWEIYNMTK